VEQEQKPLPQEVPVDQVVVAVEIILMLQAQAIHLQQLQHKVFLVEQDIQEEHLLVVVVAEQLLQEQTDVAHQEQVDLGEQEGQQVLMDHQLHLQVEVAEQLIHHQLLQEEQAVQEVVETQVNHQPIPDYLEKMELIILEAVVVELQLQVEL
tara:strand:- start:74 stop:529 length:456 start_codon:yes stop_codon:yes gene_type:complete